MPMLPMERIDSHQHYWNPARGDHDWMPMDNLVLARPYTPADLSPALKHCEVDGTVLVQAAATVNETEYILGLADATATVAAVVGWVDFEDSAGPATLSRLAHHPKFVGVRPMIQDISDTDWMLREDVDWAYGAIIAEDLTFDALGFPRHLENFLTLLKRHPDMRVVIDHCMKPQIADHSAESFAFWADGMTRLARETNAFCKLSGLITEAGTNWTVENLRPYADHVLEEFGSRRIMWGSDWPVCRLRGEYEVWRAAAGDLTAALSRDEQSRIFGGTATEFYRLAR